MEWTGLLQLLRRYKIFTIPAILVLVQICISVVSKSNQQHNREDYLKVRRAIIEREQDRRLEGPLTDLEKRADYIVMKWKMTEIEIARKPKGIFLPAEHFMEMRHFIDKSRVFQTLKLMPKGGLLHIHDASMFDAHWMVKNATYDVNCYMCAPGGLMSFHFFPDSTSAKNASSEACQWKNVVLQRSLAEDIENFDKQIYQNLTIVTDNPTTAFPTQDDAWERFADAFRVTFGLLSYAPVFKDYLREALIQAYMDGVLYMEIRTILPPVYHLEGTKTGNDWLVEVYRDISKQFSKDHPDFIGIKLIISSSRGENKDITLHAIQEALRLYQKYPDIIVGYDLVGAEDPGHTLLHFLEELLYPTRHEGIQLPYFFHAGETDWQGENVDENLLDALLLNASRIGHGYALLKHPVLKEMSVKKDIPLEISPISNQVLMLVKDLRNHPANVLVAEGHPLVISSDDPGMWGADPLSHDFYMAFMALGGNSTNLATMKKFCLNSLRYSAMSGTEKTKAIALWEKKWNSYINNVVKKYMVGKHM